MNTPAADAPPRTPVDVMAVIDGARFSRYQWQVVALCLLVGLIDGFENGVIAYVAPALTADLGIGLPAMGNIFAAGTVGMAVGSLLLGVVADRWGRKRAVVLSVAVFGVAALATAASTTLFELMACRFVAGIAIGGAQPVMVALLAEYAPARHRNTAMVVGFLGVGIGVPISALLTASLVPLHGWQSVFVAGGVVPLLVLPWLAWVYPESIRFLVGGGARNNVAVARTLNRIVGQPLYRPTDRFVLTETPAPRASGRELLAPRYRRATLAIWVVYLFNWITWYLFLLWLPTALTHAGLDIARASQIGAVMGITALLTFAPAAVIIQRAGAARCMVWLFAGGTLMAGALAAAGTHWSVIAVLVVPFTICGVIPQVALNYLCVELYPTPIRATGVGWAITAGRFGSVLGALVGGGLIAGWGLSGYFATLAGPLALAGVLTCACFDARNRDNRLSP
jgi:AAHS family 4-hydroxybenzoate transporter-like MFS transporter